jgi:hypothetical protein
MDDKELIKLAYTLGFQAGMEKQAQLVQGFRNLRDALTGSRGNDAYGRLIQAIKGLGQAGVGFGRGATRFGKELASNVQQGYQNGSVSHGILNGLKGGFGQIRYGLGAAGRFLDRNVARGVNAIDTGVAKTRAGFDRAMEAASAGVNKVKQTGQAIADRTAQEWARY